MEGCSKDSIHGPPHWWHAIKTENEEPGVLLPYFFRYLDILCVCVVICISILIYGRKLLLFQFSSVF